MLYNGEQIGDGLPPQVDIAVDPLEGTELCANGLPNSLAVIALVGARHDVRPGPVRLHDQDGHVEGPGPPARPRPPARRDAQADGQGEGRRRRRRGGDHARPPPPRGDDRARSARPARASASSRTATSRPRCIAVTRTRRWTCSGASAARPRACCPPRPSSASAARSSASSGRATTRSGRPPLDAGYDLDEVLDTDRLVSGRNVFFSATGVTDGDMLRGVHFQGPRGRHHRVAGHALALGHGAQRQRPPRPREAARDHRRTRLRLEPRVPPALLSTPRPELARPPPTGARSSRASERRNAWVTITWMRSWVIR